MGVSGSRRFAVLLCKFSDSAGESEQESYYQDLFEQNGTDGLADYWRDASLGHIDLAGSKVFGWKTLGVTRDDYVSSHPGRWDKVLGAIQAFELDTTQWDGYVAVFHPDAVDAGAAGNGVLCSTGNDNVTFLAHETGHVMGLDHSFDTSSRVTNTWSAPGEYFDRHDIMSAMNVHSIAGARFSPLGPLLATPNLDRMGWLDPSRVWQPQSGNSSYSDQFDLVSLGHPERTGYLAARIGDLYVEFRTMDGWDAAIPRAAVLIHRGGGANAIVLASDPASFVNDWLPGQTYGPSAVELVVQGGWQIRIDSFDLQSKTARINVAHRARPPGMGPGIILGGVANDGGGWIILPSGKIRPVPPRSPLIAILEKLAPATDTEHLTDQARRAVHRAVLRDIASLVRDLEGSEPEG